MAKSKKPSYEESYPIIEEELNKRRGKWYLNSLAWLDFDDVKQIIASHIYKKWSQWDHARPLRPWLNRIISNQLKNILRNYYSNYAKPCLSCPFNQSGIAEENTVGLCSFTESKTQCGECPLYAKWEKTKKAAYNIKMASALDNHVHEIKSQNGTTFELENAEKKLHAEMKLALNEKNYEIYNLLFIENLNDEEVAKKLGYKTTEKGRKAGYKQIKNLKKQFKAKAEYILKNKDIFYGKD